MLVCKGTFGIMIDQGEGMAPYQGITPLVGSSLADCAETYFAQSEQLPTRFALTISASETAVRAGGIMLQHLPKASPHANGDGGSAEGGLLTVLPAMMPRTGPAPQPCWPR